MTVLLALDGLSVDRPSARGGRRAVLRDVTLTVRTGEMVGLLGPNGAGKSSLMEAALGLIRHSGSSSLAALPAAARARAAAWMPQAREIAWPVQVEALVGLGRLPWPGDDAAADAAAVEAAITRTGLTALRGRTATRLSGGEQARVLLARALAQDAPLLLADEPIAGLDPAQQLAMLTLLRGWTAEGRGTLMSIHDLGLAARFCTRLVLLAGGRIIADGPPDTVLTGAHLAAAFGIRVHRVETPYGPAVLPLPR